MEYDLQSIADARQAANSAWEAYLKFRLFEREDIDAIVDAMALAIEPEARRLAELAVEETGCGNVEDKRIKNLFNSLSVADWLRNIKTRGILWRDDVTKIAAVGEPMGVVAALIPVTNPTSTVIYKIISAIKSGNAIVCAPHPKGVKCGLETAAVMIRAAEQLGAPPGLIQCLDKVTIAGTTETDETPAHLGCAGNGRTGHGESRLFLRQTHSRCRGLAMYPAMFMNLNPAILMK